MYSLKDLADLMFPNNKYTVEELEKKYPERNLPEGVEVTRFAPSPTGFVHMGSLLSSFEDFKVAKDSNGIFYLRIEDTDQKRSVENGIEGIIKDLADFNIVPDEGMISETESIGNYGPYIQSERKDIYYAYAKDLVERGYAYPCFCTEDDLNETREIQELNKERIGYYGSYAKCRFLTNDERAEKIKKGECVGIIGTNGSGKSTIAKEINDLQYTLALTADRNLPPMDQWLDQFETFDIYKVLPVIMEMLNTNFSSLSNSEKKVEAPEVQQEN